MTVLMVFIIFQLGTLEETHLKLPLNSLLYYFNIMANT